jgi:hypothetical protein
MLGKQAVVDDAIASVAAVPDLGPDGLWRVMIGYFILHLIDSIDSMQASGLGPHHEEVERPWP